MEKNKNNNNTMSNSLVFGWWPQTGMFLMEIVAKNMKCVINWIPDRKNQTKKKFERGRAIG